MAFQSTKRSDKGFARMHPNVAFSHGSSGGVVAVYDPDRYMYTQLELLKMAVCSLFLNI